MPGVTSCRLTVNCRNLPRIGTIVELISKMSPGYHRYRRTDDGVAPRFLWTSHASKPDSLLRNGLRALLDEGFLPSEIVVLSPLADESTSATTEDPWLRNVLIPWGRDAAEHLVRYTTVHRFKGLDSPAVIITDATENDPMALDSLLYVALTRATDRLTVVASPEAMRDRLIEGKN